MKNIRVWIMVLISLITFWSSCLAGDSVTLPVSITIPAIPGVNAPPFPQQTEVKNIEKSVGEIQVARANATGKTAEFIASEDSKNPGTQTIYSR